jgi:hypothetical protein
VIIKMTIAMNNPSFITITIGDIQFDTFVSGVNIGPTILKSLTIAPGTQNYLAEFHLTPMGGNNPVVSAILSGYLQKQTLALTVKGSDNSTSIASLKDGLAGVSLTGSLTGIDAHLITGGVVEDLSLDLAHLSIGASTLITIQNPLDVQFSITAIKAAIYYKGTSYFELASIDYTFPSPFTIGAKSSATSGKIPITFIDPLGHLIDLAEILLAKSIVVDISQNATVVVGDGFDNVLTYSQPGVTIQNEIIESTIQEILGALGIKTGLPNALMANVSSSASAAGASTPTTNSGILPTLLDPSTTTTASPTTTTPAANDKSTTTTTTSSPPAATSSKSGVWPFNLF